MSPEAMATWGPIILMVLIFYLLLYRPQKKQQKRRKAMLDALKVGSQVMTIGGIFGTITQLSQKVVTLEIADNVEIRVSRSAVNAVVTPEDDDDEAETASEEK